MTYFLPFARTAKLQNRQFIIQIKVKPFNMGYSVTDLSKTSSYVLANGVALLIAYAINYFCHFLIVACYGQTKKQEAYIHERVLQTSRVMYWFGIATMFSVFPPFYYGLQNAFLGWLTLLFVILMHLFCFIRRFDGERSVWSYFYYFFHVSCFIWIVVSLIVAYYWSLSTTVPTDITES